MSVLKEIKNAQLQARKDRDKFKAGILTCLYSEASIIGKNNGNRETTDDECLKCIQKFKKGVNETLNVLSDEAKCRELHAELEIYDGFLPKQMSTEELETVISVYINDGITNIGQIMEALKKEHGGAYDAKMASQIIKTLS